MKQASEKLLVPMQFVLLAALVSLLNARSTRAVLLWGGISLLLGAALVFAYTRRSGGKKPSPEEAMEALFLRRKVLLWSCAGLVCAGIQLAGIYARDVLPRSLAAQILLLVFAGFPFLLIALNQALLRRESRRWNEATAAQMRDFLASHRQTDKSPALFREMDSCRKWAGVFTWGLSLSAGGLAFTAGLVCRRPMWLVPAFLLSYLCLICCLSRIRLKLPRALIRQNTASPEDYPKLYALAGRAQETMGLQGEIQICFSADCNAGLAIQDGIRYVELGVTLLSLLTEEELYAVLLHEFGHAAASTPELERRSSYSLWLNSAATGRLMEFILLAFFGYFDFQFSAKYRLYEYAVSLQQELLADQAMLRCGSPAVAGSALLKLAWFPYYQWEHNTPDNPYLSETMSKTNIRDAVRSFLRDVESRSGDWTRFAASELPSSSDSHPTLKARLEAMGIGELATAPGHRSEAFRDEVDKALDYVDDCFCQAMEPEFQQRRQAYYQEPLEDLRKWKDAGAPLEEYPDMLVALQVLGKMKEAEALCDRAIRELPDYSCHDALCLKGTLMLHRYDPAGIPLIYRAIRENPAHTESGMAEIGNFCCLTGHQKELEEYREKALEFGQRDMDARSPCDVLRKSDRLSKGRLSPELEEKLLEFLRREGKDLLKRVYLLRKQITKDFSTGVLVVQYREDADPEKVFRFHHRLFLFLDKGQPFCLYDYDEVRRVHVEKIPGSCIYEAA